MHELIFGAHEVDCGVRGNGPRSIEPVICRTLTYSGRRMELNLYDDKDSCSIARNYYFPLREIDFLRYENINRITGFSLLEFDLYAYLC